MLHGAVPSRPGTLQAGHGFNDAALSLPLELPGTAPTATASDFSPVAPQRPVPDPDAKLACLREQFEEKANTYQKVEAVWRGRAFKVALILGALPVITGIVQLLPEWLSPWITLLISLTNVFVVVASVKVDMGERVADASMASKSYDKLASQISFFIMEKALIPEPKPTSELLLEIKATVGLIEGNVSYPESIQPILDSTASDPPTVVGHAPGNSAKLQNCPDSIWIEKNVLDFRVNQIRRDDFHEASSTDEESIQSQKHVSDFRVKQIPREDFHEVSSTDVESIRSQKNVFDSRVNQIPREVFHEVSSSATDVESLGGLPWDEWRLPGCHVSPDVEMSAQSPCPDSKLPGAIDLSTPRSSPQQKHDYPGAPSSSLGQKDDYPEADILSVFSA